MEDSAHRQKSDEALAHKHRARMLAERRQNAAANIFISMKKLS
jgi:hypothetical protein